MRLGRMLASGVFMVALGTAMPLSAGAVVPPAPPNMSFTPDVRADGSEGAYDGQDEPVDWVDQTGTTYITWQSASRPGGGATNTVSTTDGVHFQQLGSTDPGHGQGGDVTLASTSWPSATVDTPAGPTGENGLFWGDLGQNTCGPLGFRASYSSNQGQTWSGVDAGCQPAQIDRDWIAAYTPPAYRGTPQALQHTSVYDIYHDFGISNVWFSSSTNGGQTWSMTQQSTLQPLSAGQVTSFCNTYPGGIAVDQNGTHKGRIYVVWNTGDLPQNAGEGCNLTSAAPFDHIFISYSDDGGASWTTHTVFNDPCAPTPPVLPTTPTSCQDTSEGWNPVAVDDAGNVYVAFTWIDTHHANPEYDVYLEYSKDGGNTWNGGTPGTLLGYGDAPGAPIKVSAATTGTNFYPEMAAGGTGGVDIAWYNTSFVTPPGTLNKPAAQPGSALWNVVVGQSLDVLDSEPFTVSQVNTHPIYFGDICTIGIACGSPVPGTNWAYDRTLFDNFGLAVGPDGAARVAWTDARESWGGDCQPGGTDDTNVACETTHVYFACQKSGVGIHGEPVTGCGPASPAEAVPEAPYATALVLGGAAIIVGTAVRRRRRYPRS